jgi:hypothetical protein
MPYDIIDNRTEKLVDHIRRILPGSQLAKFAVGYFFPSGLTAVAVQLTNVFDCGPICDGQGQPVPRESRGSASPAPATSR